MPWHCLQGPVPGIRSDCSGLCTHRGQNLLREGLVMLDLEGLRGSHVTFQNFKSSLVTQKGQAALTIVVFSSSCLSQSWKHRPHVPVTVNQTVTLFHLASEVCVHPQYHSNTHLFIPRRWIEVACCMQYTQKELIAPLGLAHRLLSCSPHQAQVEGIHQYSKPQRQTLVHLRLD